MIRYEICDRWFNGGDLLLSLYGIGAWIRTKLMKKVLDGCPISVPSGGKVHSINFTELINPTN